MATAVFGIATTYTQADVIIDALKASGFANHDISLLFSHQEGTRDFAHEKNTKARRRYHGGKHRRRCPGSVGVVSGPT